MRWFPCVLSKRMHEEESWQVLGALGMFVDLFVVQKCTTACLHPGYVYSQKWIFIIVPICMTHIYTPYCLVLRLNWQETGDGACYADQSASLYSGIFIYSLRISRQLWDSIQNSQDLSCIHKCTQVTRLAPLIILLSKPQQSSCRLRWMIVCIGRHANVYALLHNSLITALLPHTYTRFSAIIISQGHS